MSSQNVRREKEKDPKKKKWLELLVASGLWC
jgi:hypothetical protein